MTDRQSDQSEPIPIERDDVHVMYLRTSDDLEKSGPLWERLESQVGLRGRKFFGAFYASANEYRVCVQMKEGDDPKALGLETGTLPGGRYLRKRLRGEAPEVYKQIGPTFQMMVRSYQPYETRPGIEFYRKHGEIDCLLRVVNTEP